MSKSVWRAPKAFVATTIGLISTLIIAVPPASAAVTTINIVADSLTYPAGSSVIPTLTAQVSAASGALVTCKVYATSDTSFLTPIDMAGIPTGTNTTYKIHCTATAASASYAIGTITDGVLTVKPNNPLSCTSDFYQVRGGAFFKLNANSTPAFTYNAWGANSITSFNGMGWNQEDNYLYGSDGSGSGKYIYQLAADGSTFAKFVLYTNTANPAGASAAYVPTHLAAATTVASKNTGGDFYTFNGQQYLVQASSSGMDVIDVRSRTVVQTMTSSAWAAYDIAFKGNVGYGVNNSATASTLYIGTVSGTDPKTATVTVTTKTLSALVGSASENFGAAYMDSDGNLFAYGNTSNKLYEISKTELAKTNPAGVLITTATGATGTMNDGASCGTAASPSAPTMTTTTPATLIKSTTATVAGTITTPNLAGSDVVSGKAWLCYATTTALLSTSPTCNSVSGAIAQGTSTPAALSVGLTGLSPGTTYYFQSKATNSAGSTAYGSVQSFATLNSWTLTAGNFTYTIGGSVPTITATATPSGGINGVASCAVYATGAGYTSALTISSLSAGTYVTHCTATTAAGYDSPTNVDGTLNVTSLTGWSITGDTGSYQTPGTAPAASGTATPAGGLSGSLSCNYYATSDSSYSSPVTISNSTSPGTYNVRCTGTPASGYAAASLNNGVLTVTASTWALQAQSASYTIGSGSVPTLTASATPAAGLSGSYSCAIYTRSDTLYTSALTLGDSLSSGTYVIHCTGAAATGYAAATLTDATLTVSTLNSWTLNAQAASFTVGGSTPSLTATATPSGGMSGQPSCAVYSVSDTGYATPLTMSSLGAGSYVIRCTASSTSGYASPSINNATLTVSAVTSYNVTFDSQGGSAASGTTYSTGGSVTLPSSPTRSGYSFAGWFAASSGGSALTSPYSPSGSGDITLYAHWTASTYNVTFDSQGGSAASGSTYSTGGSVTLPSNPTRSGYSFAGWFAAATGGSSLSSPYSPSGSGDITLYAHWTANTYNVTFDSQGGSAASGSTYSTGGSVTLPSNPTRSGYSFAGWFAASTGGSSLSSPYSPSGSGHITLYAHWTANTYNVTFDSQGGSAASGSTYFTGGSVALPSDPTQSGYSFAGWFAASTGGAALASPYSPAGYGDITLYAQWTVLVGDLVHFNSQGGTPVADDSYSAGGSIALTDVPTRVGYAFAGWYETSTGGTALSSPYSPPGSGDITLYAQWTANTYNVTFDSQGGSAVTSSTYSTGGSFALPTGPTRSGYSFAGWFAASAGGLALTSPHSPSGTGDLNLYAHWTANSYVVQYDSQGGASVGDGSYIFGQGFSVAGATTRSGYNFVNWFDALSGGTSFSGTVIPGSPGDISLYAHWTAKSYNVTFDSQGGSAVSSSTYSTGGSVALPSNPTRSGYSFAGWFAAASGGAALSTPYSPTGVGDITLYAHWTAGNYIVHFDSASGSAVADRAYRTGGTVSLPSAPTRLGYSFAGWFAASSGGAALASPYSPSGSGDITLYAHWTATTYNVTFNSQGGSAVAGSTYSTGGSVPLPSSPTRSGYTFAGWFAGSTSGSSLTSPYAPSATGDITIYAQWTANTYTVRYDSRGGSFVGDGSYLFGQSFTVAGGATRSGFNFVNWFDAVTGGTAFVGTVTPGSAGDISLYAHWSALSYNVTFDSQGGSTVSNLQYSTGGSLALPAAPTRSGFIFAGWFAAPSGGSALASPFSPQGTGDITLYAQWTLARLPQTISMPRIGNQLLAVRSLEVHPTASSGLDVVLVSMTPNECGVDEFIVNLDAVGTCRLKASQAGDSTYLPEVVISTFLILAPSISGSPIPTPTPTVVSSPTPSSTPSVSQTPTPSPSPTTPSNGSGVRRVTFDELPQDVTAGFEPSAMLHIEVTGARTAGQFVLTPGGVADAVGIAAALRDSAPNNAADFASVTTVQVVSQVPSSNQIFHASISSDIDKVFAESGLENPRSVSDIAVGSTSWLNVKGRVTGYVPGSVVYMIVTTRPTILQAVVVGVNGMATLSGFVPLDGLPSGPHNIRIVGTRQLQGATATASGTQKLDAHAVHEVGRFDPGTQATVVVRGTSSSGGQFTAIREVLLDKKIAWWTLLLALLFSLAGLIAVALRRPASRRFTYAVALLSVASALPAAVIGWNTSSYVLWWAIPIALVAAVLQVLTGVRKNKG